jgi:hypothetical protein
MKCSHLQMTPSVFDPIWVRTRVRHAAGDERAKTV